MHHSERRPPYGDRPLMHIMEMRVPWHDTDSANIVHHANYFHWTEQAEIELFRKSGKSRKQIGEETGTMLPRLHVECDHFSPVYEDDLIEVRTKVLKLAEKTFHFHHEIHRPADEAHLATVELVICCAKVLEDGTMRASVIPDVMAAELRKYLVPEAPGGDSE